MLNTHNWFPHTSYKKWLILRRAKRKLIIFRLFLLTLNNGHVVWLPELLANEILQLKYIIHISVSSWVISYYVQFSVLSHYRIIKSNKNLPFYPTWCMPGVGKCLINLEDQKQNLNLKICHFDWSHLKQRLMEIDFYWIFIHLIILCQNKPESWLMILCKHSLEDFLSSSSLHT